MSGTTWQDIQTTWADTPGTWENPGTPFRSILPPNATAQERDLEASAWRLNDPPNVADVCNTAAIPAPLLPWLAWALAVDEWDSAGADAVKRSWVARSAAFHRIKGTLTWFEQLADFYGAELVRVVRPPNVTYAGKSFNLADLEAWLETLDAIRIRRLPRESFDPGAIFANVSYFGACYAVPSNAAAMCRPQAFYFDGTSEEELPVIDYTTPSRDVEEIAEIARPENLPGAMFAGGYPGYAVPDDAATRTYLIEVSPLYDSGNVISYKSITPGGKPQVVFPQFEAEIFTDRAGMFGNRAFAGGYLEESTADRHVYWSVFLYDKPVGAPILARGSYAGATRFKQPAYTAELQVRWPMPVPYRATYSGGFAGGFLCPPDYSDLYAFIGDVGANKPARDAVSIDLNIYQVVTADSDRICGDVTCGEMLLKAA